MRLLFFALCGFSACLPGLGGPITAPLTVTDKISLHARWEVGEYLFQQKQFPAALIEVSKVAEALPSDIRPKSLMGTLQILTGDLEAGEATLLEAWRSHPNDVQLGLLLGEYYLSVKFHAKGFFFWEHVLSLDGENHSLRHALVRAYIESGRFDRAAPHIKLAIQFQGGRVAPDLDYAYGLYLANQGRWKESHEFLERGVSGGESRAEVLFQLGLARMRVGENLAAAEALSRSVAAGNAHPEAYLAWGEALFLVKKWEDAETVWLAGLRAHPGSFLLMQKLSENYLQTARPVRAEKVLEFAKRNSGDDLRIRLLHVRHYRMLGQNASAALELKRVLRQAQGDLLHEALWQSALLDCSRGHRKQAEATAGKLIAAGYKTAEAHLLRARLAALAGDPVSMAEHVRRAGRYNPSDSRLSWVMVETDVGADSPFILDRLQSAWSGFSTTSVLARSGGQ